MKKLFLQSLPTIIFSIIQRGRFSLSILSAILVLMGSVSVNATEEANNPTKESQNIEPDDDYYIGVFVGSGRVYNDFVDVEGFANWGHPGSSVDYDNTEDVGGLLIGKKVNINGMPLRLEIDGTFGNLSASTNKLDPIGLDETAETNIRWIVTTRAGIEKDLGPVTVFASGGLAVARVSNSVIDIDFGPNKPPQKDLDDSFFDDSIQLGFVLGMGTEVSLSDARTLQNNEGWTLRMEGVYINLGEDTYHVNHSGGNSCGPNGPRRPCSYTIKNETSILRLVVIRQFSL